MSKQKFCAILLVAAISVLGMTGCVKKEKSSHTKVTAKMVEQRDNAKSDAAAKNLESAKQLNTSSNMSKEDSAQTNNKIRKADLYGKMPSASLPLSSVNIISTLPENVQETISKIIDSSNGVYFIEKEKDKIFMIIDNELNPRHNVEFVELSTNNPKITKTTFGYNDKINDFSNEIWDYDKETKQPKKHTTFDENGDIIFVENWYYDSDNPVKYEIKNGDGEVISMRKETQDGDSNLLVEHLLYDKDGKTKMSVTSSYDGADVKRFTYYNSEKPKEGASVFSEYSDGLKTKETIYTTDYKLKNIYTSSYKNGEREDIKVYDENNNEIECLVQD